MHCGLPSQNNKFCCLGCSTAYSIIHSLNLQKFYEYCIAMHQISPMKPLDVKNHVNYCDDVILLDDEQYLSHLLIEGVYCGSCVWLIEKSIRQFEKVISCSLNMSTKRLRIKWRGDKKDINEFVQRLMDLGYRPIPFVPDIAEEASKKLQQSLLIRLSIAALASVSMMMILWGVWAGNWDGSMGENTRIITHIIASAIALPAIVYCSMPFIESAILAIRCRKINMDVPISFGIVITTITSTYQVFTAQQYTYFDAATTLLFFLLLGRFLEMNVRNKARQFASDLLLSQPKAITLIVDDAFVLVPINRAKAGDIAFIAAGEKIPADGVVIEGQSSADHSLISGESAHIAMCIGSKVIAGTLNIDSGIKIKITAIGENSTLGEIIKLIEVAEQNKSYYIKLSDKISQFFMPSILILGAWTFLWWKFIIGSDFQFAINASLSLIIVTCPCALGIAVPYTMVATCAKLMKNGIITKTSDALEKLSQVNTVVFDKTGTLTAGRPECVNLDVLTSYEMSVAKILAQNSKHVLSRALVDGIEKHHNYNPSLYMQIDQIAEISGMGISGYLDGEKILLGSSKFCNISRNNNNLSEICLKMPQKKAKHLFFQDNLKEDAVNVVDFLQNQLGFDVIISSGDKAAVVAKVAEILGVKTWFAEQQPADKYSFVKSIPGDTLMVGDGLNDAIALQGAFVSMSPATSLDIAQVKSDITFTGDKVASVIVAYNASLLAKKLIKQNLAISLLYNAASLPLAMSGAINPVIAAIMMSSSSMIVLFNSLRALAGTSVSAKLL